MTGIMGYIAILKGCEVICGILHPNTRVVVRGAEIVLGDVVASTPPYASFITLI